MSFLTPWFLLGGLAIAGPILFHLIRRAAKDRMPFSSIMFLRPTPQRVTRRRKLEHLSLLLLRCLALLLLAAGFARPFFSQNNAAPVIASEGRRIVLLLDTSASMRRDGVWEKARSVAEQFLKKSSITDQIAIMTFDRQPRILVSFAEWSSWEVGQRAALAQQRLSAVVPGWMGTHLGLALTTAAERFEEDSANGKAVPHRELVLITDLQEGAKLDGLQGHEWPTGVKVTIERVEGKHRGNAGLGIVNESTAKTGKTNELFVRVTNARDSKSEKFQLNWTAENGSKAADPMEIYLPSGQMKNFRAPKISPNTTASQLRLSGDDESFDNSAYYVVPEIERVTIAYFGSESATDAQKMRYYFERAFPETPRRQLQVISPKTNSAAELLTSASFAVIAEKLRGEEIATVRNWLSGGKTALLVLTDNNMAPSLSALAGLPEIQMTEATGNYALLGEIDFTHPIFAPFADPRFSDFTPIHFWIHRRWEIPTAANARVLAQFDDGSPALTQLPIGKGNLLVLASSWSPADSQLAVSSKFPPLMHTILDWSGAATTTRYQFLTGDSIPSPDLSGKSVEWQKPDGKKQTIAAGASFTETDVPGIYIAKLAGKTRSFAVNLPLEESRTAPLSPDELARLGVPLKSTELFSAAQTPARQRQLQQTELENRQKLWRWLIVGVLAITLAEIILSGRLARRVKTVETTA